MGVRILPVSSYDDPALRRAVERILHDDERLKTWRTHADSARLVVVKPNWIQQAHEYLPEVWEPVITHPALVAAVVATLAELMGGLGTIAICDAPHAYADFAAIVARGGLQDRLAETIRAWPSLHVEVLDLRREVWQLREEVVTERRRNLDDPRGYVCAALGTDSLFFGHHGEGRYYGADYDSQVVNAHHHGSTHEYLVAGTPLKCDLFVNLPKLKTHKKTGVTCALKNLVGINGDKNWLPHHTQGTPDDGGDEFPERRWKSMLEQAVKSVGIKLVTKTPLIGNWAYRKMRNAGKRALGDSSQTVRNGNWSGNDTCWRMALDLNRALLYCKHDGSWSEDQVRPYLAIVDGIVGGEGEGPLCPTPVTSGVLIAGQNPSEVDAVACRLMGFDPAQIPIVSHAFDAMRWRLSEREMSAVRAVDDRVGSEVALTDIAPAVPGGFKPHFGWVKLNPAQHGKK